MNGLATIAEESKNDRMLRLMLQDTSFDNCLKEEEITAEERAYRRGYRQGFYAARYSPEVTYDLVCDWSLSFSKERNPGSPKSWLEE